MDASSTEALSDCMAAGLVELPHGLKVYSKIKAISALPFAVNSRGVLVHRTRGISIHHNSDGTFSHHSCHYYCGAFAHGVTLVAAPDEAAIVCMHCEARCNVLGLPSATEIVGRHVHVGGKRAFAICHPEVIFEQPTHCSDCGRNMAEVGGGTCDTCR